MRHDRPLAAVLAGLDHAPTAIDEQRRRAQCGSGPQTLAFDFRVMSKRVRGAWHCGEPEVDRVAEVVCAKAQTQADDCLSGRALYRLFTAANLRVRSIQVLPTVLIAARLRVPETG
jgi:hypothetical protein